MFSASNHRDRVLGWKPGGGGGVLRSVALCGEFSNISNGQAENKLSESSDESRVPEEEFIGDIPLQHPQAFSNPDDYKEDNPISSHQLADPKFFLFATITSTISWLRDGMRNWA
jgi:hypothetical protein